MHPFHPYPEDLPQEFAVFPLTGALLLPRGKLPLNIFEPRYLAMTLDSLATGRMFGMVQPDLNAPVLEHGPGLYRVGCLGRLSSFSETDDGKLLVTLTGLIRFTIDSEIDMHHGYRRVRGDFSRYIDDLDLSAAPVALDRENMLAALRGYFGRRGVDANWEAIRRMPDDALVVTLAMACPFEPVEKQALLEAPTPAERAATLLALLQMGAAGPDLPPGHSIS
ncbi:LON peptidase substrate-binding domain-containing protein [Rhodopila globiformis]|uniref:Peptidase S16 n=1 Tax=Rhodopila globiformis TaxID=1071 RepID=A0A2S6NMP8_RHOGL|nr:LON peptidase substrate-binding domain-containing protein [Rhodopila globiformis]PPQ37555.1 peptidase S16 [Rhodopila globiformis]